MSLFKKIIRSQSLIVGLLFFVATSVATYPILSEFTRSLPGSGDVYTYAWTIWWFMYSIVYLHQSPFETNFQFYPLHVNISQDLSIIHGLISMPITYIWGPIAAYNFIIFFTFVVTGVGFYLFAKLFLRNNFAAFFGSLIYTFSYNRQFRALIGQVDIASTEWIGFCLYFLSQLFIYRKHTNVHVLGAAIFLAMNAYTEYRNFFYMILFSGVFICISIVVQYIFDKDGERKDKLIEALKSSIKIFLLLYVLILPIVFINTHKIGDVQYAPTYIEFNANPSSFILFPCNVLLSRVLNFCYEAPVFEGKFVYLGMVPIFLMMLFLLKKRSREENKILYIFTFCFVFFIVLSLGTFTPVYRALFTHVPLFKIIRVPSRLVMLVEISLAILSALGLQHVLLRIRSGFFKSLFLCILLILFSFETLLINIPYTKSETVSQGYLSVLKNIGDHSILEIPFGFRGNIYETLGSHETGMSFYFQMKHRTPIVGGYMSMIDWQTWNFFNKDPLIQKLVRCQEEKLCESLSANDKERFIKFYKIRYIFLRDSQYSHFSDHLVNTFLLKMIYKNEELTVWENPLFSR